MAYDLYGKYNGDHPPYRSHKMLNIRCAVIFNTDNMGKNNYNQST